MEVDEGPASHEPEVTDRKEASDGSLRAERDADEERTIQESAKQATSSSSSDSFERDANRRLFGMIQTRIDGRRRNEQVDEPSQDTKGTDNIKPEDEPTVYEPPEDKAISIDHASPEEKAQLLQLIEEYPECFSWNGELGSCDLTQHRIHLITDEPVWRPAYKVAHKDREFIETEVRDMLDKGVIEPSISPYAAGVVLVPKNSGGTRFCVDYRGLNQVTKSDHYPLPLARTEIFDTLGEARIFSCLDCQQGYWQVSIAEEDRHKTAFRCFLGQ